MFTGKALVAAQTLLPSHLLCNDISHDRVGRVLDVMDMYLEVGKHLKKRKKRNSIMYFNYHVF